MLRRVQNDAPAVVRVGDDVFLDTYKHLIDHPAYLHFLWGGRDSGKSTFIAQLLILECLRSDYFRCILVKKTFESIKDAQWQTIKDVVDDWGLQEFFQFTENPLMIKCINGNRFIARGCDKPEKLKSIKDPTVAWYEEGNQLTEDDFITVSTTLRSNKKKVVQYFSFNPEVKGNYRDHWMWRYFRDHVPQGILTFENEVHMPVGDGSITISYTSTHSTYHDNPYCTDERRAMLESLKEISPYYYQTFTLGKWGNREVKSRFAFAFDRDKHIAHPVLDVAEIVWVSFDFNVNPITASVYQHYDGILRVLDCIKLANSDIYALCNHIRAKYGHCTLMITGDATGRNRSAITKGNLHYYQVIQQELQLGMQQIHVPTVNPPLAKSGLLVNAVLSRYRVEVHEQNAYHLVYDFENVEQLADGTIKKGDRSDPTQQADALDTFRYFCEVEMKQYIAIDF